MLDVFVDIVTIMNGIISSSTNSIASDDCCFIQNESDRNYMNRRRFNCKFNGRRQIVTGQKRYLSYIWNNKKPTSNYGCPKYQEVIWILMILMSTTSTNGSLPFSHSSSPLSSSSSSNNERGIIKKRNWLLNAGTLWQKNDDMNNRRYTNNKRRSNHQRSTNQEYENDYELSEYDETPNNNRSETIELSSMIHITKPPLSSFGYHLLKRFNKERKTITSFVSYIISSIHERIISDPERYSRFIISTFQFGIMIYIGRTLWTTINDIVEEFNQEQQRASSSISSSSDPLFADANDVTKLIQFLNHVSQQQQQQQRDIINDTFKIETKFEVPIPPTHLLQLGYKLLASGMPLESSLSTSSSTNDNSIHNNQQHIIQSKNDDEEVTRCSIQSLLLELTRSEANILQQCLWSSSQHAEVSRNDNDDIDDIWNNISGLHSVKERLLGAVAMMLPNNKEGIVSESNRHFAPNAKAFSSLFHGSDPGKQRKSKTGNHGILLYGPPGCGKTLLVKALAQKSQLPCLVVTPSVLLRKYVGETNLQVRSLFTLASKMSPCILCIDELDGLFRERNDNEHEVSRDLKTEFLQWWDGMLTSTTTTLSSSASSSLVSSSKATSTSATTILPNRRSSPILVIGATNRPFDVDSAVLRRLSQSHYVGLPDVHDRFHLLTNLLHSIPKEVQLDLHHIAQLTEGYTPSDLRQVLQTAAITGPLRRGSENTNKDGMVTGLSTSDILSALQTVTPTHLTKLYRTQLSNFVRPSSQESMVDEQQQTNEILSPYHHPYQTTQPNNIWKTDYGNFYHIGTLELDQQAFDSLMDIAKHMHDAAREDDTSEDE